ncbi:ECF RNA polymerase sigma factor SigK [Roseivivax jejudonensis]|uniref:ECF RNA polymerase sigma factor SigK n=1 Tax=Roseivivax jejudonensis TaxID=1529041 RepID=A0A1X6ZBU3_9RHOB|nr:sigma-70 family RNA polymerase sigma factor [Roseivivax jejudonensis]SLN47193.1 ECF RNA polymerase sigma factor SigK [Roseivivax jejudonensis]
MTPQEEVEDLLARVAMGDRKAFSTLYDRTSAKLFGICLRILVDRAEAEEALQEAYVRIWNRADAYRVNGFSPMTWLITLTRNIAIDRRRKRPARPAEALDLAETMADAGPGPEAMAAERSEAERLHQCIRELPDDRAAMVRRVYLDGDSYAELAEATGTKLNTVRTWLRRALIQLRECLAR